MPQTLTTADLLRSQGFIEEAFSGDTPSKYPYNEPAMSANALFENNAALTQNSFLNGNGKYTGTEVNWLLKGTNTVKYSGTPSGNDQTCDIGTAESATSNSQLYQNNQSVIARVEIDDDLYGNMYDTPQLISERFMAAMQDIRDDWNIKMINFLNAGRTPINNDGSLGTGITYDVPSTTYQVDGTVIDMQDPDALTDLDALAMNNDIQRYFYLTGRYNFYNAIVDSQYRRLNDDQRYMSRFSDPAYRIYTDPRSLDSTLTGRNTFVIGEGTYAVWDFVHPTVTSTPTQIEDNKWQYTINDPILRINVGGTLRPVRYNVYYTRECTSVNKSVGLRTYLHKFEIFFLGGLYLAPASEDTHTGILKLQTV